MGKIKWRKWNNILHRDIGYLAVGLTVIFAISGIAVNHVEDWNPNYNIERIPLEISALKENEPQAMVNEVLMNGKIDEIPKGYFRPSPDLLQIYLENKTIEVDIRTGRGYIEEVSERVILHDFNFLHLNHPKKWWTWFSDLYAVALTFLAISGLFVLKGKKGLSGRGKWLTGTGFVIPVLFLIAYKYL